MYFSYEYCISPHSRHKELRRKLQTQKIALSGAVTVVLRRFLSAVGDDNRLILFCNCEVSCAQGNFINR